MAVEDIIVKISQLSIRSVHWSIGGPLGGRLNKGNVQFTKNLE